MSRFFSSRFSGLEPYTPGEQPRGTQFIKLNTNESPFPPSPLATAAAAEAAKQLQLYSDPECRDLLDAASEVLGVEKDELLFTNGSDETLNFAFMAFCDADHPAAFPNITYGFYPVYAQLNGVPFYEIPLRDDFSIDPQDYMNIGKTIFIANPNAPTGIALPAAAIAGIAASNQDNVVVVDEAYVDFGGESCLPLIGLHDNLLVIRTFSKSHALAGARLGFAVGCPALIRDLNTIKYSTNPYTINSMTMAAGIGALRDAAYTKMICGTVAENRAFAAAELKKLGFAMTDSVANFLFVTHPQVSGETLYEKLRERGILVRHFKRPEIASYNRITVGSRAQMEALIAAVKDILEEES